MRSQADSRLMRLLRRLYEVLLLAYPADFRRQYGNEMRLAFKSGTRAVIETRGRLALAPFMARIVGDWSATLLREWKDAGHPPCFLPLGDAPVLMHVDTDRQSRAVSTMLAALGLCLLIVSWVRLIGMP